MGGVKINAVSLRVIRERSGLSQAELGRRTGISQGHISQLEAGEKEPRPDTVARLAAALDCPTITLLAAPSDTDCQDPPTH